MFCKHYTCLQFCGTPGLSRTSPNRQTHGVTSVYLKMFDFITKTTKRQCSKFVLDISQFYKANGDYIELLHDYCGMLINGKPTVNMAGTRTAEIF